MEYFSDIIWPVEQFDTYLIPKVEQFDTYLIPEIIRNNEIPEIPEILRNKEMGMIIRDDNFDDVDQNSPDSDPKEDDDR